MSHGGPGMRQRTRRPTTRVSSSRTELAASHSARGSASATRRWWVQTAGSPAQRSIASSIMCQLYPSRVRCGSPAGSVPDGAAHPAQARGVLVLPLPLAALRRVGEPAVLDARDARSRAGARPARRPRARHRRRRRRHRLLLGGGCPSRRRREPHAARPEPAPALPRAPEARAAGRHGRAGRRGGAPVRHGPLRPLGLVRQHRVLARPARSDRRRVPRPQAGWHRPARRPAPARAAARPPPRRPVDDLPARGRLPPLDAGGRLRGPRGHLRRAVLDGPALRDRDRRAQARRRTLAGGGRATRVRAGADDRPALGALGGGLGRRRGVRADRRAGEPAGAAAVRLMHAGAVTAPLRRTRFAAGVLWRFSRPHTIIGTALSVVGIFAIAADRLGPLPAGRAAFHLFWTLVAALAVNVFIVGLNQLEDIDIDRINQPRLPLAAGDLSVRSGRTIVATALLLPLMPAGTQRGIETAAVAGAMAIGWPYASPPLRLKRYPVAASASISVVRSLVVNLAVYLHFA